MCCSRCYHNPLKRLEWSSTLWQWYLGDLDSSRNIWIMNVVADSPSYSLISLQRMFESGNWDHIITLPLRPKHVHDTEESMELSCLQGTPIDTYLGTLQSPVTMTKSIQTLEHSIKLEPMLSSHSSWDKTCAEIKNDCRPHTSGMPAYPPSQERYSRPGLNPNSALPFPYHPGLNTNPASITMKRSTSFEDVGSETRTLTYLSLPWLLIKNRFVSFLW